MMHPIGIRTWLTPMALTFLLMTAGLGLAQAYNVDQVRIEGNVTFSSGRIKRLMKTKQSSWYKNRPFIRRNLELDLANIEAFYHKNGFLDCLVSGDWLPSEDEGGLVVRIHIEEGRRTYLTERQFAGNRRLPADHLGRGLTASVGQPLDFTLVRADMRTIGDQYGDVGYPYAKVTADVQRESTTARIRYQIDEGQPVTIGRIRYQGLRKVKASTVHRELTLRSDDLYDRAAILESRQRIYSTGLFNFADLRLDATSGDSLRPDVLITVQERPMRWVGLKAEAGQDEQYDMTSDLTTEWGHKNLFGTGRKFSLKAIASFRVFTEWENLKNRLELTFTEPWFLGHRMPAWVSLYYEPGLKSKGRSYRIQRFGGEFSISRELGRYSRAWLGLRYERVDIYGLEPEVAEIMRKAYGVRIRRGISLSWERDTRDGVFQPSWGSLTQISTDLAGGALGGDDHYLKAAVAWNRYQFLFRPAILASRLKLGWSGEYGAGQEVPPDVRFYAGGANTVRGFAERTLGPLDPAGNPLGGEGLFLFNLELRRPLWGRLGSSVFFDSGNVWSQPRRATFDQLWASTGLELWFSTPVGPIRLAHGFPLREELKLDKGRWHLGILFAF